MPPKWPSTWSAMMIEAAIVISAWRSSWPWFQRRKSCCMTRPMTPITSEAMTSERIQSPKLAVEVKPEVVPPPEKFRTSSKAMKPPSM